MSSDDFSTTGSKNGRMQAGLCIQPEISGKYVFTLNARGIITFHFVKLGP